MLCLFKNSKLSPLFHVIGLIISLSLVGYWLYFAMIDKSFISHLWSGKLLMIDLLFGLPIVLVFAVVIYAFSYWLFKLAIIVLFPQTIIQIESMEDSDEEIDPRFEPEYWNKSSKDEVPENDSGKTASHKKPC